jgi:hypothetical protein
MFLSLNQNDLKNKKIIKEDIMSNDVYMFRLKSVKVKENGKIENEESGANILEAKLIYPKEGVPALTTLRNISLKDNEALDCSVLPMKQNVLFKQSFNGESVLEFNLCAEVRNVSLEKEILKMLGIVAKTAVGTIPGLGSVATAAITSITDSIFSFTPRKTVIIGAVSIPIPVGFDCQDKAFTLTVPKNIEIKKMRKDYDSGEIYFEKLNLDRGTDNGEIVIDIVKL